MTQSRIASLLGSFMLLWGASGALAQNAACQVHDQLCIYHGIGREQGYTPSDTTSLTAVANWDQPNDADLHALLPVGPTYSDPTEALPGYPLQISEPFFPDVSGAHIYPNHYESEINGGAATATHSGDAGGGLATYPGQPGCDPSIQSSVTCEAISVQGDVPSGVYSYAIHAFPASGSSFPLTNFTLGVEATGNMVLVVDDPSVINPLTGMVEQVGSFEGSAATTARLDVYALNVGHAGHVGGVILPDVLTYTASDGIAQAYVANPQDYALLPHEVIALSFAVRDEQIAFYDALREQEKQRRALEAAQKAAEAKWAAEQAALRAQQEKPVYASCPTPLRICAQGPKFALNTSTTPPSSGIDAPYRSVTGKDDPNLLDYAWYGTKRTVSLALGNPENTKNFSLSLGFSAQDSILEGGSFALALGTTVVEGTAYETFRNVTKPWNDLPEYRFGDRLGEHKQSSDFLVNNTLGLVRDDMQERLAFTFHYDKESESAELGRTFNTSLELSSGLVGGVTALKNVPKYYGDLTALFAPKFDPSLAKFDTPPVPSTIAIPKVDFTKESVSESLASELRMAAANHIVLNPKLPPPSAGYDYKALYAPHARGQLGEIALANNVAGIEGQTVVHWGDKIGSHGSDVISVGNDGSVYLWDSKNYSNDEALKQSLTFAPESARLTNAVNQAISKIKDAENIPSFLKDIAISNLKDGNFRASTVATGDSATSVTKFYSGGQPIFSELE